MCCLQKRILFLSLFLTIGTWNACTSHPNDESSKENEVRESTNEDEKAKAEDDWDMSSTFNYSVEYESGEEGSYEIVGNKDTVGFTGPFPIIAEEGQKYFWFYFGKENIYNKPVEVKARPKAQAPCSPPTSLRTASA